MTRRRIPEDFGAFCEAFRIGLYEWQRSAFAQATARRVGLLRRSRFQYRLAGVSVPRGNGKSYAGAAVGVWRLFTGPAPQDLICAALDLDGAKVVMDHAKQIIKAHPDLESACEFRADGISIPATGSRWTITSREHTASRGRHASVVIYDEVGWVQDDELFSSLLAGQASVADPLMLVISTVGRVKSGPLWQVKTLAEGGDRDVFWYHSSENLSPRVTTDFLERQRRILLPGQYAREHQNQWVDAADSLTTSAEVAAALSHGWQEQHYGRPGLVYTMFVDLGMIHDPSVVGVGHTEGGLIYIDTLRTFRGSREAPVSLAAVEETIQSLAERFSPVTAIQVESWQGMSAVQHLARLGLPVTIFTPTQKTNADQWPMLAQALTAKTLVLFPHARLREELLNLTYEVGPQGIRVLDRRSIHQDHATVVRGIVAMLAGRITQPCEFLPQAGPPRSAVVQEWARRRGLDW